MDESYTALRLQVLAGIAPRVCYQRLFWRSWLQLCQCCTYARYPSTSRMWGTPTSAQCTAPNSAAPPTSGASVSKHANRLQSGFWQERHCFCPCKQTTNSILLTQVDLYKLYADRIIFGRKCFCFVLNANQMLCCLMQGCTINRNKTKIIMTFIKSQMLQFN